MQYDWEAYWEGRKDTLYYEVVRILVNRISKKAKSIIDVGSGNCPYLEWFPQIATRVSLDMRKPYFGDEITSIQEDFLRWTPDREYDIVLCLQVLEHVRPAREFAEKLLGLGRTVVVTVPYKWPEDRTPSHIHDPVDEEKLYSWFGREPDFSYICREIIAPVERIVHVYDYLGGKWAATNRRDALLNERAGRR